MSTTNSATWYLNRARTHQKSLMDIVGLYSKSADEPVSGFMVVVISIVSELEGGG